MNDVMSDTELTDDECLSLLREILASSDETQTALANFNREKLDALALAALRAAIVEAGSERALLRGADPRAVFTAKTPWQMARVLLRNPPKKARTNDSRLN